jgi:hypothetical protein
MGLHLSTTTVTMSSIKQVIVNAIMRIATPDPAVEAAVYESAEAARDDFVKKLLAELFPENPGMELPPVKVKKPRAKKAAAVDQLTDSLAAMTVSEPAVAEEKPAVTEEKPAKKPRAKKAKAEAPVAEPVDEGSNAAAVPPAEEKPAKKPRAKKAKAEAAPPAEGSNAAAVPPAEEKPAKKPRAKKAESGEAVKLTAAQVTKAKEIAKTVGVEFDKKAFLTWMGQLSEEERREPLEGMVRAYLSPSTSSAAAASTAIEQHEEMNCIGVEFEGEEYWVNPSTRIVYKTQGEVEVKVGVVGLAKFEHMVVPAE